MLLCVIIFTTYVCCLVRHLYLLFSEGVLIFSNLVPKSSKPCASRFQKNSLEETIQVLPKVKAFEDTLTIDVLPQVSLFTII